MSGGEASVFMAVLPVSALLLSYVFLGEKLSVIHFMGIALVIFGIVNTTLPTRQPAYKD